MNKITRPVIFFDGVCGLCNGFVDFVLSIDKKNKFLFSPLQSAYAQTVLPPEITQNLTSVVLQIEGKTFTKSLAVIMVLKEIGGPWKLAALGQLLPSSLRNKCYDLVATHRYRLFGKKESCRLPSEKERQRFVL